jgi:O-antigen ligase
MPSAPNTWENALLATSVLLLPLFYLTVKNWTETFLVVLSVLSAHGIWKSKIPLRDLFPDRLTSLVFTALSLPIFGVFISIILRGELRSELLVQNLDLLNGPSRLLVAGIGFLWIKRERVQFMNAFSVVNAVGIIITLFFATAQQPGVPNRFTTSLIDLDEFSQQICLLGLLQLLLVVFRPSSSRGVLALSVLAIIAAGKMAIAAGGRGGWIAVPPILMIIPFLYRGPKIRLLGLMLVLVATISLTLVANRPFRERVSSIYTSTKDWFAGSSKAESGGSGRLSMWVISWQLIKQRPIVGYGSKINFWQPVYFMDPSLYLRPGIRYEDEEGVRYTLCDTGEHNEYLNDWLLNGATGILSKLLLLLIPLGVFAAGVRHQNNASSAIGLCVIIIFMIHGITQGPFGYKVICSFYGFLVAGLCSEPIGRSYKLHSV